MPKIKPAANADDNDVDYGKLVDISTVLEKCKEQLGSLPPPIPRQWRSSKAASSSVINSEGKKRMIEICTSKPLIFLEMTQFHIKS